MARRKGRGRLSSIELLPPDAEPIVAWAMQELRARSRHQIEILADFNARLAALSADIAPISLSAFNRYAIRLAGTARRLEETRSIAAAITGRIGPGETDDLTTLLAETLKTLVFEILEMSSGEDGAPSIDPKGAMELARALQATVSAQSISSDRRRKVEKEFAERATKAVDQAGKQAGLSAETVETIKAKILGVRA